MPWPKFFKLVHSVHFLICMSECLGINPLFGSARKTATQNNKTPPKNLNTQQQPQQQQPHEPIETPKPGNKKNKENTKKARKKKPRKNKNIKEKTPKYQGIFQPPQKQENKKSKEWKIREMRKKRGKLLRPHPHQPH